LSATSCTIGGFAGLAAGSIFFCAALVYWRRYSWIAAQPQFYGVARN
jgi:hypothetical protein